MSLNLPEFPENKLGLKRGTILRAKPALGGQLGLKTGARIPIGFDGTYIKCCGFDWSIDQLVREIEVLDYWEIDGEIDLTDESRSLKFAQDIERLFLN